MKKSLFLVLALSITATQLDAMMRSISGRTLATQKSGLMRGFHTVTTLRHMEASGSNPPLTPPLAVPKLPLRDNCKLKEALMEKDSVAADVAMEKIDSQSATGIKNILTPLELALIQEDFNGAKELLEQGANVHALALMDNGEKRPLIYKIAAFPRALEFLIKEGAKSMISAHCFSQVLYYILNDPQLFSIYMNPENSCFFERLYKHAVYTSAVSFDHIDLNAQRYMILMGWERLVPKKSFHFSPYERSIISLWAALRTDNTEAIEQIIEENNLDINFQNNLSKITMLHEAVIHGSYGAVALLLSLGANPFVATSSGKDAFILADEKGLTKIIDLLALYRKKH